MSNEIPKVEEALDQKVENPVAKTTTEVLMNKGEQRYDNISASISKGKTRMGNLLKATFGPMGRLLKKGAFGALASPDAIGHGLKVGVEVGDKGLSGFLDGLDASGDWINAKVEKIGKGTVKGIKEFGIGTANVSKEIGKGVKDGFINSMDYMEAKSIKMNEWMEHKAEVGSKVSNFLKNKTVENLGKAKEGLGSRWRNLMEHGKTAIANAEIRRQEEKNFYEKQMNARKMAILESQAQYHQEKLNQIKAKMAELQQVESFEANMAFA
ncbi:MAG: hypothetical protein NT068_00215 [Candidatus Nomurabacteria bacterium]|nr:hypothetical protein [Candidatus Nomurabacteria bacterium]